MSKTGGSITNPKTGKTVPIIRNGNRWHIWLRDVISLDDPGPVEVPTADNSDPVGLLDDVAHSMFHANATQSKVYRRFQSLPPFSDRMIVLII
jgi:hypothetical protein